VGTTSGILQESGVFGALVEPALARNPKKPAILHHVNQTSSLERDPGIFGMQVRRRYDSLGPEYFLFVDLLLSIRDSMGDVIGNHGDGERDM
jgi:hypothetical protein